MATRLTQRQQFDLQAWFKGKQADIAAAQLDRPTAAKLASEALGFEVSVTHVRRAGKVFGHSFDYVRPVPVPAGDATLAAQVAALGERLSHLEAQVSLGVQRTAQEIARLSQKCTEALTVRAVVGGLVQRVNRLEGKPEDAGLGSLAAAIPSAAAVAATPPVDPAAGKPAVGAD
jgi:hypothetical protein